MKSIVIVEDDFLQYREFERWLEESGSDVAVTRVATESEFVERLSDFVSDPPCAFVIDVMLRWADAIPDSIPMPPEIEAEGYFRAGLRCVARLQEQPATEQVPVIVYTVLDELDVRDYVNSQPPHVRYLRKGSDQTDFVQAVGSFLAATGNSPTPLCPEPVLPIEEYENILNVMQQMALVMERSPAAFASMDEEALRSHFLVQLNGQYGGQATGETFNFEGKTDILIRKGGENIFIGECKFWGGPKKLSSTVDQLLSYSSWRDSKIAIVIFNQRKNFSKVLSDIHPTMEAHPNFIRALPNSADTQFSYLFSHRDDPERRMTITVMAFDVPAKPKREA